MFLLVPDCHRCSAAQVVSYASLLRCSGALAAALRKAAAQKLQGDCSDSMCFQHFES